MGLRLILVRHGESEGNQAGQMEGQTSTGLSPRGQQQVLALAQSELAQTTPPTHLYGSPLRRAAETLTQLRQAAGWPEDLPVTWMPELKEHHNGILAGLTWAQAQQQYPMLCHQLMGSLDWVPIPGAEAWEQGRERAHRAVAHWRQHHHSGDCLWVVSHHWLLLQLVAEILGCDRSWGMAIPPTAVFEFWLDCDRWQHPQPADRHNSELRRIRRFNQVCSPAT